MSVIEEIKARLDITDIVSENVQLRRSGKNYTGFCPFHHNVRTPSFAVFPETGTWRCFGQCNEGGDIFKFVMKREGWDFPEALRYLADRAGVQLRAPTEQEKAQDEQHSRLRELLEDAVTFYRHQLLNTPAGNKALGYLHNRGLNDETLDTFGIGYAPQGWETGIQHFTSKKYSEEQLVDAGLVSTREDGGRFDRFRHRVMIPIRDGRGRMVGFGARALSKDEPAKYLNSPQTALFNKSELLYGLDKARKAIRAQDQVVIVEGYMGVIALHQAGYQNVVAQMGTALTEQQLRMLKRLTRRIVLALDSDAAGVQATLRGLQVARQTLDRATELRFDARGLLRHEARLDADIRVTMLPPGQDPDDVVKEDPQQWARILEDARPIVAHVMETLSQDQDLNDPKVKREIANQVLPLIQDLPSAIERDTYIQQLARLLRVDERTLISASRQARRPTRRRTFTPPPPPETSISGPGGEKETRLASPTHKLEVHALGIIIRHPEMLNRVNRALRQARLETLSSGDFKNTEHQMMFRLALEALEQDHLEPLNYALDNLPLPLIELADSMLMSSQELDTNQERVFEDLLRAILALRRKNLHQSNDQLRYLQQEAQEQGDLKASQYQQALMTNITILGQLDQAIGRYTDHAVAPGQP